MKKLLTIICFLLPNSTFAEELIFTTSIKEHKFEPDKIEVPANQKFTLIVKNLDKTTEEFESQSLKQEKIVRGEKEIKMIIKPLKAGEYQFVGEFHAKTAKGKIIAK